MRWAAGLLALTATPALAHHEVVMVTSFMPVMAGLAVILPGLAMAIWKRVWKR